jgi:hypothetical protein
MTPVANLPAVSIAVPTRNQAGLLTLTLDSAFAQTVPPIEVIVSDDASTDETPRVVEAYREKLPPAQREILRYLRTDTPLGIGGNFDRAVRATSGVFCVKVDSDDLLEPAFTARLGAALAAQPEAGWAHANVFDVTPELTPIGLAHTAKRSGYEAPALLFNRYLVHNDTCHCVLLRRSAYDAAGGYRPEMRTCEDWRLWLEMALAGYGCVYVDEPLARMRKYPARPEVMSRRRLEFVDAARLMIDAVGAALAAGHATAMGIGAEDARRRLGASVARHVYAAALHETDPAVRAALYGATVAFHPSPGNRLRAWCGHRFPVAWVRLPSSVRGRIRTAARKLYRARRPGMERS